MSMILTPEAGELVWVDWGEDYIVYQPSSTETHLFNETTALILDALKHGPLTLEGVANWIVKTLGVEKDELVFGDLEFAAARLEELGLIEWPDRASDGP